MSHFTRLLAVSLVTSTALLAQGGGLAGEFSANPVPQGQPVTLTLTEAQGVGVSFPSSCIYQEIRQGSINGPPVVAFLCAAVITNLGPGQSASRTWDQIDIFGAQAPPGDYWYRVSYYDAAFTNRTQWFCLTIEGASTDARLDTIATPRVGNTAIYRILAPNGPGVTYACAASFSTDGGIGAPICLDQDPLFDLSFPLPNNQVFVNFQGFTDVTGVAGNIGIVIPSYPFLINKPLHVQAAVFDLQGYIEVTNVRSHWIRP